MTRYQFMALCGEHLIDVGIALENEDVREALSKKDDDLVEQLLVEQF